MDLHGPDCSKLELNIMANDDSYIMNSLLKCGTDWPVVFSLIWGATLVNCLDFPLRLREIVMDIIQEEEKKNESSDSWERQLHSIAIELLWLLYEREVNMICERAVKSANLHGGT